MNSLDMSRLARRAGLSLGAVLAVCSHACSSDSDGSFGGSPDAGTSTEGGVVSAGGSTTMPPGAGGAAAGSGPTAGGASAGGATPCVGAGCGVGPNPGGLPPNEPCTNAAECASGRCEPVTGTTDVVCLGACFADGAPCTRALDCCSTGCFDGVCGDLCIVENEPCQSDAECCSNICTDGECAIDEANPDCRPTGEDCTSGTSRGCCNECNEETGRCDFGAETCFAQGVACQQDGDCCRGVCQDGVCTTPCVADGDACAADPECCSAQCSPDGTCAPPTTADGGGPVCVPTGERCVTADECCSAFCFGGFCESVSIQ